MDITRRQFLKVSAITAVMLGLGKAKLSPSTNKGDDFTVSLPEDISPKGVSPSVFGDPWEGTAVPWPENVGGGIDYAADFPISIDTSILLELLVDGVSFAARAESVKVIPLFDVTPALGGYYTMGPERECKAKINRVVAEGVDFYNLVGKDIVARMNFAGDCSVEVSGMVWDVSVSCGVSMVLPVANIDIAGAKCWVSANS